MQIKIWQVNPERDKNRVLYCGLKTTGELAGGVDLQIYDPVWSGTAPVSSLEDVYRDLNTKQPPPGYKGHTLSVSDIVQVLQADGLEPGWYFCDSIGFKRLEFCDKEDM